MMKLKILASGRPQVPLPPPRTQLSAFETTCLPLRTFFMDDSLLLTSTLIYFTDSNFK